MPPVTVEQLQRWWQIRTQKTALENTQEVAPALVHFEELSVHAVSLTQDLPVDQIMEPLPMYDSASVWQPIAPSPNRY